MGRTMALDQAFSSLIRWAIVLLIQPPRLVPFGATRNLGGFFMLEQYAKGVYWFSCPPKSAKISTRPFNSTRNLMQPDNFVTTRHAESILATNTVLRNTYILLGLTLIFSAITAGLAMTTGAHPLNPFVTLIGYMALLFITSALRNSGWGLVSVFALTGFMGYTLGPILNFYVHGFTNGNELIMMSLGATGLIFFALSAYALTTKKDFSFMAGFLMVGVIVAFLGSLGAMFFHIPALMLAVSAAFVLLSSGIILFQTGQIVNGGETNYIMATVTLYVSLYNIFISLLSILGVFNGNRD